MAKYFLVFKNTLSKQLIYKTDTIIFFFVQIFYFLLFFYLWSSIYREGNQMGDYSLTDFLLYYLLILFFRLVIKFNVAWDVGDTIRLGDLNAILLKPISFLHYSFFKYLGEVFFRAIFYSFALFVLLFFVKNNILVFPGWSNFLFFLIFMIFAILIQFLFFYIIGLCSFWLGMIFGFNFAMMLIGSFFDGSIIPLDLLPVIIVKISNFLPFKYILFVPISIFLKRIDPSFSMFVVPIIWIFLLYFLAIFLFKRGLKKYEAYGA